jgi:hypothetical protein
VVRIPVLGVVVRIDEIEVEGRLDAAHGGPPGAAPSYCITADEGRWRRQIR